MDISEVDSEIGVQYRLIMSWTDPRLTFWNLKAESYLNTVSNRDAEKVWYPKLQFYNTKEKEETKVRARFANNKEGRGLTDLRRCMHKCGISIQYDEKSLIYVTRHGNHTPSPIEAVHNNHLYSGMHADCKGASRYDVRIGGGGGHGKADVVREVA